MNALTRKILEEVLAGTAEPVVVVRVDRPDWPVAHVNSAFESLGGDECRGKPFADVIEALGGREIALEVSETVRSGEETSHPVEVGTREFLLIWICCIPGLPPSIHSPWFWFLFRPAAEFCYL